MRSCRTIIVIANVFGHNLEGLMDGKNLSKSYAFISRIDIFLDLNLRVIIYFPLYAYFLRARISPLGILLPCTVSI